MWNEHDCGMKINKEMINRTIWPVPLTSDRVVLNYLPEMRVNITGKVTGVFPSVIDQWSIEYQRDFKLFKFLLQTKEGKNIDCVAWEDLAFFYQSRIHSGQVITLENVLVRDREEEWYNRGHFKFQLVIYPETLIHHH